MNENDDEWIEQFYADLERGDKNYKRPADYKERAYRILNRQYAPVGHKGLRSTKGYEI